jgi:hypothetical protein
MCTRVGNVRYCPHLPPPFERYMTRHPVLNRCERICTSFQCPPKQGKTPFMPKQRGVTATRSVEKRGNAMRKSSKKRELMTFAEYAERCGVTYGEIIRAVRSGELVTTPGKPLRAEDVTLYTRRGFAKLCGCSHSAVNKACACGRLTVIEGVIVAEDVKSARFAEDVEYRRACRGANG